MKMFSIPTSPIPRLALLVAVSCVLLAGCGEEPGHEHGNDHETSEHTHDARHGGIAVVLGDEEFHVEFTHGEAPGVLQAYVFDGHMENYVRSAMPAFSATVLDGDLSLPVVFAAIADTATGETVGDTALFEATAAGLHGRPAVTLHVPELVVRGITYNNIKAEVPAAK